MKTKISSLLVLLIILFSVSSLGAKQTEQYVSSADIMSAQKPEKKVSLEETLNKIENGYDVIFLYQSNLVNGKSGYAESIEGSSVFEVIDRVLKPHNLISTYIDNRTFVISNMEEPELEIPADSVFGVVTDASTNQTLPGVNILVKGTVDRGTTTDLDGRYVLRNIDFVIHI